MAMTDYFKPKACEKIVQTVVETEYGDHEVLDSIGASFDGLLVRRSLGELTIGADRGKVNNSYNLYVYAEEDLQKDDKVKYTYSDGRIVYIRITTDAVLNDELSGQTDWKTYEAESYIPAGEDDE